MINIDTDLIIPKQYLKNVSRHGLKKGLFSDLRYRDDGLPDPNFILNKEAFAATSILIAGDNFGCGSSREHAQWALLDWGVRCVVSTTFAGIFYANCINNGILPARVSPGDLRRLLSMSSGDVPLALDVDLASCCIGLPDGDSIRLEIDNRDRRILLEGRDPISKTLELDENIRRFDEQRRVVQPWL